MLVLAAAGALLMFAAAGALLLVRCVRKLLEHCRPAVAAMALNSHRDLQWSPIRVSVDPQDTAPL